LPEERGFRQVIASHRAHCEVIPVFGARFKRFQGVSGSGVIRRKGDIGATRTRDMRNIMALALICYGVAVAVLIPLLGNPGVWLALLISFAARGLFMGLRYPALERDAAL